MCFLIYVHKGRYAKVYTSGTRCHDAYGGIYISVSMNYIYVSTLFDILPKQINFQP